MQRGWALLAAVAASGCHVGTWDVQYPGDWPARDLASQGSCPQIAGLYEDKGERRMSEQGGECFNVCDSLISQFTSGSDFEKLGGELQTESGRLVEIQQAAKDALQVTELQEGAGGPQVLSTLQLAAAKGDFACEGGELRLRTRVHTLVLGIANGVEAESRTFSRASDGSLVMKRFSRFGGHNVVFPEAYAVGEWVRWPAVAETSKASVGSAEQREGGTTTP